MKVILNHIPKNWKPNDPEAVAKWFNEKLPTVKNYKEVMRIESDYEKVIASQ